MADRTERRILSLMERVGRLLQGDGHAAGLQPVQWEVLRYLDRANRFSRTPADVTAYLGITKGTVSQTLKALEGKGLVRKRVSRADRRSRELELTGRGRRLLTSDPVRERQQTIGQLTENERAVLSSALSDFLAQELARQGQRPFGVCRDCVYHRRDAEDGAPHYCALLEVPLSDDEAALICAEQAPRD